MEAQTETMGPLGVVQLTSLMDRTSGRPEIAIGLIDGPVLLSNPDIAGQSIQEVPGRLRGTCSRAASAACLHGTFVAGILCGRRRSAAPAICPGCTLLVRPIYSETDPAVGEMPSSTPDELAEAIVDCIDAGARVLNLSLMLANSFSVGSGNLGQALDYAISRGVIVVAAAGNQGLIGNSAVSRHAAVIPVTASDLRGRPLPESNLGHAIGRRGLMAPGVGITSLGTDRGLQTSRGTSAAAPFVTGTIALLWSEFPRVNVTHMRLAVLQGWSKQRRTVVPPMLDSWAAYQTLNSMET
jgi:subtilisin family serine protease